MERRRRKWTAREQWLNIRIEDEAGRSVCTVYGLNDAGRRNAHEIAALPDLLDAAKLVAPAERSKSWLPDKQWETVRAAIAKAEGRS